MGARQDSGRHPAMGLPAGTKLGHLKSIATRKACDVWVKRETKTAEEMLLKKLLEPIYKGVQTVLFSFVPKQVSDC